MRSGDTLLPFSGSERLSNHPVSELRFQTFNPQVPRFAVDDVKSGLGLGLASRTPRGWVKGNQHIGVGPVGDKPARFSAQVMIILYTSSCVWRYLGTKRPGFLAEPREAFEFGVKKAEKNLAYLQPVGCEGYGLI